MRNWLTVTVLLAAPWAAVAEGPQHVPVEQFGQGWFFAPTHGAPQDFLVMLSPSTGWNDSLTALAQHQADAGAAVLGLDVKNYYTGRAQSEDECLYPTGLVEEQAQKLQKRFAGQSFKRPILVGLGDSGGLAAITMLQTLPGTYRAVIAPAFCPTIASPKPLCVDEDVVRAGDNYSLRDADAMTRIESLHLAAMAGCDAAHGWPVEAKVGKDEEFIAASLQSDEKAGQADALPELNDLSLHYLPSQDMANEWLVVFISGDGGWRDIDRSIGGALQKEGYAVIGLDSLQYFWRKKTPVQTAAALDRIVTAGARHWGKSKIVLAGYSFGADIMPFAAPLMKTKALVRQMVLFSLSKNASFEITVGGFMGRGDAHYDTLAALKGKTEPPVLCVYGEEEAEDNDTVCPLLKGPAFTARRFPGGHHYDRDYREPTQAVIETLTKIDAKP